MASLLCSRDEEREPDTDPELMQGSAGRKKQGGLFQNRKWDVYMYLYKNMSQGLTDNPVVKTHSFQCRGLRIQLLAGGAHIPPASEPRGQGRTGIQRKQYCSKLNCCVFFLMVQKKESLGKHIKKKKKNLKQYNHPVEKLFQILSSSSQNYPRTPQSKSLRATIA